MTSDDKPKTKKPTYAQLAEQYSAMRKRVWTTREQLFQARDEAHDLRIKLKNTEKLCGPSFSNRTQCNDGRVWATPLADTREGWICCFAGQALCGAFARGALETINPKEMAAAAEDLWNELESRFMFERAEAEKKAEAEADKRQGKLWDDADRVVVDPTETAAKQWVPMIDDRQRPEQ